MSTARSVYVCSLCGTRSPSISLWMSHLRQVHSESDLKDSLPCLVGECGAIYSKVNSLCSHVYRKHKDSTLSSGSICIPCGDNSTVQESISSDILSDLSLPNSLTHDINQLLHRDVHEQKKKSALYLLQLKEERMLTQAAINDVVTGCREVFEHTVCRLRAGVSLKLSQSGIDSTDITSIFDEMSDPFVGLETAYLQDKFISQELECIVSKTL